MKKTEKKKSRPMFGEEMIWLFIFGDLCTFTLFFFYFGYERVENLELYRASQATLNLHYGSVNTLVLLASSWFVVLAAKAARRRDTSGASTAMAFAFILGLLFAALKLIEYKVKIDTGITFETNNFYLFYFLLTGLHLTHVIIGLGLLAYFVFQFRWSGITELGYTNFTSVAIFWHMVDLLWIIIFTLLYLIP